MCIYDKIVFFFLLPGGAMNAMYCYSPLSDSWSLVTRLGERASCAIAACNNKLFITGGRDNKNQVISTVMCWDVDRGVLTEECVLPMGVSHHGSVTLMKSYTHIHRVTPAAECQWQKTQRISVIRGNMKKKKKTEVINKNKIIHFCVWFFHFLLLHELF